MIELKNNLVYLKDEKGALKPVLIYSGEIHYFRIPSDEWEDRLNKAKKAGLNCISSYIPWLWHEPEEGKFDFTGLTRPERNLLKFIELVKEHNLYFIARVGPYFNAELVFDGLPEWLVKKENITRLDEKIPHFISYLDPVFLDYVKKWYQNLFKHISEMQITKGGNIIFVQLCNEIGVLNWLNKQPDLTEHGEKFFREHSIKGQPKNVNVNEIDDNFEELIKWERLYSEYFFKYFKTLKKFAVESGIEIPFIVNIAQFEDYHDRGRAFDAVETAIKFDKFKSKDVILGGDFYPKRLDYDNFHDVVIAIEILKTISIKDNPLFCMELQSGFIYDRPRIYPSDVELLTTTCIGHGITGLNFYMFSGGINFENIGVYGKWHDWQSPISSDGSLKPSINVIENISKIVTDLNISNFEKVYDVNLGIYKPYFSTMFLKGEFIDEFKKERELFFHDGLLRLLATSNVNFKFIDLEEDEIKGLKHLIVFSFDWMDENTQNKLIDFTQNGNLVVFYDIPIKNLKGERTYIFEKFLNADVRKFNGFAYKFVKIFDFEIPIFSHITTVKFKNSHFKPFATFMGDCAGFIKETQNGKFIFVGFGINQRFKYQNELIKSILENADVKPVLLIKGDDEIHASLLNCGERYCLFVANFHEEPKKGTILIKKDDLSSEVEVYLEPRKSKIISL
jgi:beta-galactosidase